MIPFIVENGLNSSSIDSLFVSLFFKPSYIQNILSEYPENISFIYLQELIYENFVCNMRRNYFIDSSIINEIRNYMVLCGWKNCADVMNTYDVQELYSFLINGFCKKQLIFHMKKENEKPDDIITMPYIELKVTNDTCVKTLLENYFNNMSKHYFNEIPEFVPIYLNRTYGTQNVKFNNFLVDIKEGINFSKYNICDDQKKTWWKIHSIICFSGGENGHYYSIVSDGSQWFLFSNSKLPSLLRIDIKNGDFAAKIKQDCVFLLYTLNG